ncbi:MAG: hypothetical protein KKE86_12615 [Planctomycetes bacterium]|nr:hypothetical protein [Planctomycetota bacterium]MBU4400164.1 hypothetical protein [Planctomycetota bacterium]MCG2685726.1 hypothetical protein [Planctomycetales bacterium]
MTRTLVRRLACWTLLGCLAFAVTTVAQPVLSAEDKAPAKPTTKKKEKAKAKKGRHRLPPYFGDVVGDEQREKIYKIQDEYRPKIEALRAELKALVKERDEKIEAVLTPEQKQQIDEARAEAKAKRKANQPKPKKPADKSAGN